MTDREGRAAESMLIKMISSFPSEVLHLHIYFILHIKSFYDANKSALQPFASVCLPWPIYGVGVNDTKMIEIMIR